MPVLELAGLCMRRNGVVILEDVSWRVEPGQHWAILGANGSGKTSLLGALTGYMMPTAGEIHLLGRRFRSADWRELRTQVGLVSAALQSRIPEDEEALATVLSGRHAMLGFWGEVVEAELADARRTLDRVEGGALAGRAWRFLSQGERQRVLVGRALMARPELLILDEPCAGLDPAARERFLHFLQRLGAQPSAPTLVLVTHHVEEIMPVFTHALVLRRGRVLAAGPLAATLSSRTLSAAFDAPARLHRRRGRYRLAVEPGEEGVF